LLGIDEKTAAYALPAGKLSNAQNLLLDEKPGVALKRFGSREISLFPTGNSARDGEVFQKVDGSAFLLASDGVDLYFTTDPTTQGAWVLLFSGLNFDGFLEFETAEDKIWMSNGIDPVMSWDGTTLRRYERVFDNRTAAQGGADLDAVSVSSATIRHASLTEADNNFWNGQQLVFTKGANVGVIVTITDFDAATDTLTFTPAITGEAITDRWKLGLKIPRFRSLRFWDARLWGGSSDTNTSELRFHQLTDPNTGNDIDIDHPLAWPPEFQLDIASADGDRIWGISPVSRDRILAFKQTGLFRIERSPLTIYTFEEVTKAIGSRFQRSWREKGGALYFVGRDKDGLPDVFKTDMVVVRPVDPVGGVEPTLRDLRQPNTIQKTFLFSSKSDFNLGTLSSWVETLNSRLESKKVDDLSKMLNVLQAGTNIDIESNPGKVSLLGWPSFSERVDGILPDTAPVPWLFFDGDLTTRSQQIGFFRHTGLSGSGTADGYRRPGVVVTGQDFLFVFKIRQSGISNFAIDIQDNTSSTDVNLSLNNGVFHVYHLLKKPNGVAKLWRDGVLIQTHTSGFPITFAGRIAIHYAPASGSTIDTEFVGFIENFKGDKLNTQGGKIGPITLPDTLPTTGNVILQNDYLRAPDALRRVHAGVTLKDGTVQSSSFTSDTVDFSTGNDPAGFVDFVNGAVPASLVKQFQRVKYSFTINAGAKEGPIVTDVILPFLWLSPVIFNGQNIAAWRTFLANLTQPTGTELEIKIRETTILTPPDESDFAAFKAIVDGDNIGTILADGTPPTTRQIQYKVEGGPDAAGVVAFVESMLTQWNEGSEKILPLHAIVHKKRYQFAAARGIAQENDIIILADRNDAWMKFFGWTVNFMVHFRGLLVAFNSNDDKIIELDSPDLFNDLGQPIDAFLETREETLGDEELRKDLRYTYIHTGELAHKLDLSLRPSQDAAFGTVQTITTGGIGEDVRVSIPFPSLGRRFQRKYRNNIADEGMEIKGETLYYVPRTSTP